MNFREINRLRQQSIIVLFALLLIAQVLFPIQLHTRVAQTASGKTVILCTLQGHASAAVDDDQLDAAAQKTESSPAVKFSQLLSTATPIPAVPIFTVEEIASTETVSLQQATLNNSEYWRFSIRAPPAFLI